MAHQPEAREEIGAAARHAKQFGQLRHDDGQGGARLETGENAFGEEIDDDAEFQEPGQHEQTRGQHRGQRHQRQQPVRIAPCQLRERHSENQRDGRSGADGQVPRRPEERVAQSPGEVTVKTRLWRQPGQGRVGERNGDGVSREGEPRQRVRRQPLCRVAGQPLGWWKERPPPGASGSNRLYWSRHVNAAGPAPITSSSKPPSPRRVP